MQAASIRTLRDGKIEIDILNDNNHYEQEFSFKYNMSTVKPIPKRMSLTYKQNTLFIEMLLTPEGREIVNNLKNERSNALTNALLKGYKKQILENEETGKGKNKQTFTLLVDQMINEPLTGQSKLSHLSVGLTKREIYDAFIHHGLIKI